MIRKIFTHLEGIKKETKRSSTSIFLQKVCRNLYFTMNFQFTVYKHVEFRVYKCITPLDCFSRREFAMFIKYERRKTFSSVQ